MLKFYLTLEFSKDEWKLWCKIESREEQTFANAFSPCSCRDPENPHPKKMHVLAKEKGPRTMLFVAFIFSIVLSLIKLGTEYSNPFFFTMMFDTFTCGLLFPVMLTKSKKSLKRIRVNLKVLFTIDLFGALMCIFVQKAMGLAIVPYVISVKRMNIIFSMLFGYSFFKERRIMERLIGALVMVFGVLLTSLFSFFLVYT